MTTLESLYELYLRHPLVTTDSRDCPQGSIFFALKGDTFDGNLFAARALEQGCAAAVVDNPEVAVDQRYMVVHRYWKHCSNWRPCTASAGGRPSYR